jgi:hypothetical protein
MIRRNEEKKTEVRQAPVIGSPFYNKASDGEFAENIITSPSDHKANDKMK